IRISGGSTGPAVVDSLGESVRRAPDRLDTPRVSRPRSCPRRTTPASHPDPRYFAYYHQARTHLALDKDAPDLRPIELPAAGTIVEVPEVGACTTATSAGPRSPLPVRKESQPRTRYERAPAVAMSPPLRPLRSGHRRVDNLSSS